MPVGTLGSSAESAGRAGQSGEGEERTHDASQDGEYAARERARNGEFMSHCSSSLQRARPQGDENYEWQRVCDDSQENH